MDKIKITDLEIFARHGVMPEETALGQKFIISAELSLSLEKAGTGKAGVPTNCVFAVA